MSSAPDIKACTDRVNGFVHEVEKLAKEWDVGDFIIGCCVLNDEEVKANTHPCVRGAKWFGSHTEAAIQTGILIGRLKCSAWEIAHRDASREVENNLNSGLQQSNRSALLVEPDPTGE